jgi:hypothetical protein
MKTARAYNQFTKQYKATFTEDGRGADLVGLRSTVLLL